jgi:hypothetical protein
LRVRLDFVTTPAQGGNRLYFQYAGPAPTGATCITIANDIAAAWGANIAPLCSADIELTEVDVLDITSALGSSGQWTGSISGSRAGTALPTQVSANIEFNIARRYRGGKPRIYLPAGVESDLVDPAHFQPGFLASLGPDFANFITAVKAISVAGLTIIQHINLSYYQGFTNVTNSSGRTRAAPKYRLVALQDNVEGYAAKAELSSQKRRRTATTP